MDSNEKYCLEVCGHEHCNKIKTELSQVVKVIDDIPVQLHQILTKFRKSADKYNESINSPDIDEREKSENFLFDSFHYLVLAKAMVDRFNALKSLMDEGSRAIEAQHKNLLDILPKEARKSVKEKWDNLSYTTPKKGWKLW